MKLALLGPGRIAGTVAQALVATPEIECYAVASRSLERAEAFAEKFGFQKAYGSYEEMLSDPEVQLVYITTPHSHHYEQMLLCLEYGKNVICEKAFTLNAGQARKVFAKAREKGLEIVGIDICGEAEPHDAEGCTKSSTVNRALLEYIQQPTKWPVG